MREGLLLVVWSSIGLWVGLVCGSKLQSFHLEMGWVGSIAVLSQLYVQFVIQCQRLRSRLLSSRWYCRGWTTEMPSWPVLCLPVPASSVGDERGSTAHLRPASLRPHLRRTHQPPLAPGSGESAVHDGRAHVKTTHGTAPSYLSQLVRVADLPGRRSLRSARPRPVSV